MLLLNTDIFVLFMKNTKKSFDKKPFLAYTGNKN